MIWLANCLLAALAVTAQTGGSGPPQTATNDVAWAALEYLVGDWAGEGSGSPGQGAGGFTFKWDLDRKILVRTNFADYTATKERPAFSHRDLMLVYADPTGSGLRAIYFDNEGHVINYAVRAARDPFLVEFASDPAARNPRYRLSYTRAGNGAVSIKFEIAPPGKPDAFSTYIEARARRK